MTEPQEPQSPERGQLGAILHELVERQQGEHMEPAQPDEQGRCTVCLKRADWLLARGVHVRPPEEPPPEKCDQCLGQGWYVVPNRRTGEPEQEQCARCLGTGMVPASLRGPSPEAIQEALNRLAHAHLKLASAARIVNVSARNWGGVVFEGDVHGVRPEDWEAVSAELNEVYDVLRGVSRGAVSPERPELSRPAYEPDVDDRRFSYPPPSLPPQEEPKE